MRIERINVVFIELELKTIVSRFPQTPTISKFPINVDIEEY